MEPLRVIYCRTHGCTERTFEARLFARTLYTVGRPMVPVLGGRGAGYFAPDRQLITAVGAARTMEEVREAILEYWNDLDSKRWLRRYGHVRISTRKLKRVARHYLPDPHRFADTESRAAPASGGTVDPLIGETGSDLPIDRSTDPPGGASR